jgi:RHS repeat-associated protein
MVFGQRITRCCTRQPFTWNGAYGYEWIPEVGLYHVGARAYDPRTARWLQRDPIDAASGDPNLYRYCRNDPISRKDIQGASDRPKNRPHDNTPTIASDGFRRDCAKAMDELKRAIDNLKKDVKQWGTLPEKKKRGHANEMAGRCVDALKLLSTALAQCTEREISKNASWRDLIQEAFPFLYQHCNPDSKKNPGWSCAPSDKVKHLRGVYRESPVYTYEPGLNDLTSLMVPAVAAARCGIGLGGLVQGTIEWLENLFSAPSPQPAPAQEEAPKKQKRAA